METILIIVFRISFDYIVLFVDIVHRSNLLEIVTQHALDHVLQSHVALYASNTSAAEPNVNIT